MDRKAATADAQAAAIAARQHGVASSRQLREAGLSATEIRNRVRRGRLHRVHRSVYAVGHPGLSNEGRWMAAVLACGEGAVLSHRSAAELWALLPAAKGDVHVTVPGRGGRDKRRDIHLHRSPSLTTTATTRHKRIAVTTPARTLTDLRRTIDPALYRKAVREAEFRNLALGAAPTDHTRSELERAFLRLCRRRRLPLPEVNVRHRRLHRRLPLARGAPDRRDRRLRRAPGPPGVRGRPYARARAARGRLSPAPVHRSPGPPAA